MKAWHVHTDVVAAFVQGRPVALFHDESSALSPKTIIVSPAAVVTVGFRIICIAAELMELLELVILDDLLELIILIEVATFDEMLELVLLNDLLELVKLLDEAILDDLLELAALLDDLLELCELLESTTLED